MSSGEAQCKALVIDDHRETRGVLRTLLEMDGFGVIEASGGVEGHRLARDYEPNLVITDILMPGMDGIATAMELRSDPRTTAIPVIAITGEPECVTELSEGPTGLFSEIVPKPVAPAELRAAVGELVPDCL
jgi:two-component system phosphate regulon response regulator PhoB